MVPPVKTSQIFGTDDLTHSSRQNDGIRRAEEMCESMPDATRRLRTQTIPEAEK